MSPVSAATALALVALIGVVLSGCTALGALNATVGSHAYTQVIHAAYGPDPRQKLDIYLPRNLKPPADVVVFFYGGRWRSGDRHDYRFVAEALTSEGFIAVIPDYRLYPEVSWRGFVNDGAAAYHWVETHIARHHGNPARIFLMGHSAGAHIAAMVTLDEALRTRVGSRIPPCGMIGLAGPYDFLPFVDADVKQVFSSARRPLETQPVHYVAPGDPPLLLLLGADDTTVDPRNSDALAAAARAAGNTAQVIRYPGIGHVGIVLSLAQHFRFLAPTLRDTARFIRNTHCVGGAPGPGTAATQPALLP